mmetsp:Transcript_30891/g.55975  ORF Transcript_30891/g.55975 Transcript_30891/m.55975 type:complete len:411 (-) Transcript_30891:615-1847(-)
MHIIIALLALIPYLQPVDGTFMTPSVGASSHAILSGWSPHSSNITPTSTDMKSKSKATDDYEQDEKKSSHIAKHKQSSLNRRQLLQSASYLSLSQPLIHPTNAQATEQKLPITRGKVFEIEDPNTFSAVVYIPPAKNDGKIMQQKVESFPLLVVLHGAGNNKHSALYEFTQAAAAGSSSTSTPPGDHTNLPPYLLSTHQAPSSLSENFVVVAPYVGKGKRSLYDEPRGKLLSFVKWFNTWLESQSTATLEEEEEEDGGGTTTTNTNNNSIAIDRQRVSLLGFSEGSTLAVELATTRQFNGVVLCSYGFTGVLPKMAVERLQGIPIWVFHSKGDDIYDIQCSNALVDSLIASSEGGGPDVFSVGDTIVKYTKLIPQQNGDSSGDGKGREHVRAALVASKDGEVYSWLLSLQ